MKAFCIKAQDEASPGSSRSRCRTFADTASPLSAIAREDAGIVELRHCGIKPRDKRLVQLERHALR